MNTTIEAPAPAATGNEQAAWNEAHDRLHDFFQAFALGDHAQVSRLTMNLLERAKEIHRCDPWREPVSLVMGLAQKQAEEWLADNLDARDRPQGELVAAGYVALLLSRAFDRAPDTFLTSPLPQDIRESMRETLLVTGPDLQISSMTPRPIDYGPMLVLARKTWHRWNSREIAVALLFWAAVYCVFYWWLSEAL